MPAALAASRGALRRRVRWRQRAGVGVLARAAFRSGLLATREAGPSYESHARTSIAIAVWGALAYVQERVTPEALRGARRHMHASSREAWPERPPLFVVWSRAPVLLQTWCVADGGLWRAPPGQGVRTLVATHSSVLFTARDLVEERGERVLVKCYSTFRMTPDEVQQAR